MEGGGFFGGQNSSPTDLAIKGLGGDASEDREGGDLENAASLLEGRYGQRFRNWTGGGSVGGGGEAYDLLKLRDGFLRGVFQRGEAGPCRGGGDPLAILIAPMDVDRVTGLGFHRLWDWSHKNLCNARRIGYLRNQPFHLPQARRRAKFPRLVLVRSGWQSF